MAGIKITVNTTIRAYGKKKGKGVFSLGLGDVKLTEDVRNKLDSMIDNAEKVKLVIEPIQEKLPTMEDV